MPVLFPFNFHVYDGLVPAFCTVAVNVTGVFGQMKLSEDIIVITGAGDVATVITIWLEPAVLEVIQVAVGSTIIEQFTTSLFCSAVVVKTGLLVPTFVLFIFH